MAGRRRKDIFANHQSVSELINDEALATPGLLKIVFEQEAILLFRNSYRIILEKYCPVFSTTPYS